MYERILVGTDGSSTAAIAVERAVEVAKATGARLTIFSVGGPEAAGKVVAAARAEHEASGVEIDTATAAGDPATELVQKAADYDLLVVGNKGMTGATRFLMGSVPNKVSHHASVALLIVRTT